MVRDRIRAAKIEDRLIKAFNGDIELTPTQVTIGLGLHRKILPDLSATELSGELNTKPKVVSAQPLTSDEWGAKYAEDLASQPPAKPNGNGQAH